MHFEETSAVSHPASDVLETMIERMEEIVPFMPNVAKIETAERGILDDGRERIVRHWTGSVESVPSALQPFFSEELASWIDTALWTAEEYKVEWSLSTSFSKLYDCGGVNYFEPHPDDDTKTRIRITGELTGGEQ